MLWKITSTRPKSNEAEFKMRQGEWDVNWVTASVASHSKAFIFLQHKHYSTNLQTKGHHHKQAKPAVQGVEVGFVCQVVRIKHCLEAHSSKDEGHSVHTSMQDLDIDLLVIAENSVRQNA